MNWELILAWLGMGVMTDYLAYRLVLKDLDLTLRGLIIMLACLVFWPPLLLCCLMYLADSVTVIRRRDR